MDGIYSANGLWQPSDEEVLAALRGMLESEALRLSERNRRFLAFVVRQAIDGHADRIKAYSIGVDVFGRDDSFDPMLDPIVRIEATRLRSALAAYYDGPGKSEAVRISIPKGSYIPVFSCALPGQGADERPCPVERPASAERGTIVIHEHPEHSDPASGLRRELFVDNLLLLLRQAGFKLRLVPAEERSAAFNAISALFADPGTACTLDVRVRTIDGGQRYSWRLTDLATGEILASNFQVHAAAASCVGPAQDFAAATARTIAELFAASGRSGG